MGPPASSRQKEKEKEKGKPKIRNLRRYIIGGYLGASSRQPAKREGKRERKTENQKFEAVYNRRGLEPPAGSRQKAKEKERGKPKIRNLRRYIIGWYFGTSSRQPNEEREGKKGSCHTHAHTADYRPPGEPARYTNMGNAPNQATSKVVRKRLAACVRGCLVA